MMRYAFDVPRDKFESLACDSRNYDVFKADFDLRQGDVIRYRELHEGRRTGRYVDTLVWRTTEPGTDLVPPTIRVVGLRLLTTKIQHGDFSA